MGYVPAKPTNVPYTPVEQSRTRDVTSSMTEAELYLMKRSATWVIFLSCLQMTLAFFDFLASASFLMMLFSMIFAMFGVAGVYKRSGRLLAVHFVYSLLIYVLSLLSVVWMIMDCYYCNIWNYIIGFAVVIFQAIGLRHSRILMCMIRQANEGLPVMITTLDANHGTYTKPQSPQPQKTTTENQTQTQNQLPMYFPYYPDQVHYPTVQPVPIVPPYLQQPLPQPPAYLPK